MISHQAERSNIKITYNTKFGLGLGILGILK